MAPEIVTSEQLEDGARRPLAAGDFVVYHGSLEHLVGRTLQVAGPCQCEDCPVPGVASLLALSDGSEIVGFHVRPASVTEAAAWQRQREREQEAAGHRAAAQGVKDQTPFPGGVTWLACGILVEWYEASGIVNVRPGCFQSIRYRVPARTMDDARQVAHRVARIRAAGLSLDRWL